ncbi:DEAD/DEAH box helicase [Pelagibacterium montanilacus]|uniref:DEAD/DEAH box helicase n=1 Tax=Pelagibacterium montanilacus TaxID=2185280 RepID=UPI000F8F138E|nr:DEAD/DEAH box helicase [Pelagibacterium montanilacus]
MTQSQETPLAPLPASIPSALAAALDAQGYHALTPVQLAMLEPGQEASDLLVSAQTGSGKTVAFGLAVAPTLLEGNDRFMPASTPLGLVIAPTRELAMQVRRELDWLYARTGISTTTCVGGMDMRTERRALERGAHLVVGTPGRLRDHIMRGGLDLSALRAVVLDEADEMLDLGFREDLEFILSSAPEERRTLLFSATVPRAIAELARTYQRDAVRVSAGAGSQQHTDIEYQLMVVRRDEREHAIINTLLASDSTGALVFCHTREAVRHLAARLANRGFAAVALSGEMAQSERTSALQAMRDGRARVCVATDVAARGIDLPNLDLVIHADVPSNPATLLHRSGRTGRAGRKGICVLIVPEHRRRAADRVLDMAGLDAGVRTAPTIGEIEARYRDQILEDARATPEPEAEEAAFVTRLVEELSPRQLAAALLANQWAARPTPEEVSPVELSADRGPRRRDRDAPREGGKPERMSGGVWFSLSLGRKQRADPKWLLPMICKAGGVKKPDVGSIRIEDSETLFEISPERAGAFAEQVKDGRTLEKGIRITPASAPGGGRSGKPRPNFSADGPRPYKGKPRKSGPDGDARPGMFEGKPGPRKPKNAKPGAKSGPSRTKPGKKDRY